MRVRRAGVLLLLAAGLAGGLACGESSGPSGPPSALSITVGNNTFSPASANLAVGGTVTWTWAQNSIDHNIVSAGAPSFVGEGGGGTTYDAPHSYQTSFGTAGTYVYFCDTHGTANTGMYGQITVK